MYFRQAQRREPVLQSAVFICTASLDWSRHHQRVPTLLGSQFERCGAWKFFAATSAPALISSTMATRWPCKIISGATIVRQDTRNMLVAINDTAKELQTPTLRPAAVASRRAPAPTGLSGSGLVRCTRFRDGFSPNSPAIHTRSLPTAVVAVPSPSMREGFLWAPHTWCVHTWKNFMYRASFFRDPFFRGIWRPLRGAIDQRTVI